MNSTEFKVIKKEIGFLEVNYDEIKQSLEYELSRWDNYVVGGDAVGEAKTTRANLNKIKKIIDDRRKELKAEFMKPYEVVDAQLKELVGMIDGTNKAIDVQIKAFEEAEKQAKYEEIIAIWNNKEYHKVEISEIFDERWLNKTVTLKKVEEEIVNKINEIENNLSLIESLVGEKEKVADLQAKYLVTLNLQATLQAYELEKQAKEKLTNQKEVVEEPSQEQENEIVYELSFKVYASEKQINELNTYLKAKNIKVERI